MGRMINESLTVFLTVWWFLSAYSFEISLEIAKNSADEEFPQLAELHEKENRLAEVEQQLQLSEAVDTTINVDLYAQLTELFPTIMSKQDSYVKLEAGEAYPLKKGDNIIVTVKNTNKTMAQMLRTTFYKVTGEGTYQVAASASSMVVNTGSSK